MPLFQNTVLKKYLNAQDKSSLTAKWGLYKAHFQNPAIQENIRNSKEEQYQGEFLIDLFVNILGYSKNPTPNFNLTTEYKNVKDSKKADGAILINDEVKAVIELKGTETTDLNKIEGQAFGYKNNQPKCRYVITSNFEKLRFYIDNTIDFIDFNLFELTEQDFNTLYLCLAYENLSKDLPAKIKGESLSQEDAITKQLYKDYSQFKRELFNSLVENNKQFDALTLFKKSQKLLDRFLFLFFAEDRLLLPPNSIRLILKQWKQLQELDEYVPLYDRFKKYFGYLNSGYKGKKYDVFAYNGGLFKPDEVLDTITVEDDLLYKHTLKLSEYNFESEVDVNILGHIFENSLNEIEEIQAELEGQTVDKSKTKRKKDGVFYTPKYITKYIVENTVGKLCEEKKQELEITDENYQPAKQRSRKRLDNLQAYRDWLLNITICDPACGSGAFLNQALEFLIEEHRYIDELSAKYNRDSLMLSDVENSILENNLFGVDLNEEAVEIAKLSLWLRTAQKNRKLNDLSNNIKCGNSLIDISELAGDKAFYWEKEFAEIFANGGFDVVIGNPPYVRVEFISEDEVKYYKKKYSSATGKFDLSSLFYEKSIEILNQNGIYSIISSYQFIHTTSGIGLRKLIGDKTKTSIVIFSSDSQVFKDATTYAGIFISCKKESNVIEIQKATNELNQVNIVENFDISKSNFTSKNVIVADMSILKKIESNSNVLYGRHIGQAKTGVVTSADQVFYLTADEITERELERELIYPIIGPNELDRWNLHQPETLCLYPYTEINGKTKLIPWSEIVRKYPNIMEYLNQNREILQGRSQGRKDYVESEKWYQLNRPREKWIYDSKKIIYPGTTNRTKFAFDNKGQLFRNARVYAYLLDSNEDDDYLTILPILNSKLSHYLMTLKCPPKANNYYELSTGFMESFPFIMPEASLKYKFIDYSNSMISLNETLFEFKSKFFRSIKRKFDINKLSLKLESWDSLNYKEFVNELGKKKIKLTLNEEAEWEDYFEGEKQKVQALVTQIEATDKEIDQMVYELYGLTQEEIEIVENI